MKGEGRSQLYNSAIHWRSHCCHDARLAKQRKRTTNDKRSSTQSISLPMMLINALLSISTLTPSSGSTTSSNRPGLSVYSRLYAIPAQPFVRIPMRSRLFGLPDDARVRRRSMAVEVWARVIEYEVDLMEGAKAREEQERGRRGGSTNESNSCLLRSRLEYPPG
jgi:hypothetical protein